MSFKCESKAMCHGPWMMFVDLFRFEFSDPMIYVFAPQMMQWSIYIGILFQIEKVSKVDPGPFLIKWFHTAPTMIEIDSFFMSNAPAPPLSHCYSMSPAISVVFALGFKINHFGQLFRFQFKDRSLFIVHYNIICSLSQ